MSVVAELTATVGGRAHALPLLVAELTATVGGSEVLVSLGAIRQVSQHVQEQRALLIMLT